MPNRVMVLDIVGLSASLLGEHCPFITQLAKAQGMARISPAFPALTTTAQSNYITGKTPETHGIVGNGWYDAKDAEVKFWKQSNRLVEAEKIWEAAKKKDANFTCAKTFWWYNMYAEVDYSVTPRPQYHADGVKMPDCYTQPPSLRDELQAQLGTFPLFEFWGPNTSIKSSQWILDAAAYIESKHQPHLHLIYLPHLDYCLQKYGHQDPRSQKDLRDLDQMLQLFYEQMQAKGIRLFILSEYGINPVSQAIHINRYLREWGGLQLREEQGLELLDAGASKAFACADHQIAHVYLAKGQDISIWKERLQGVPGVSKVLDKSEQAALGLAHSRSGDLVLVAQDEAWFTYYYWLDDTKAPDFARCVDIHRKPGYDPVEMFMDPKNPWIKLKAGYKLLRKKLGFRYLMNVIPLEADYIKGSHGSVWVPEAYHPILIGEDLGKSTYASTEIYALLWEALFGGKSAKSPN